MSQDAERMKAIQARCDAATEGPWEWHWEDASLQILGTEGRQTDIGHVLAVSPCEACQKYGGRCLGPDEADAAFLAASRQDVPWLLSRLAALEGEQDRLREAVGEAVARFEIMWRGRVPSGKPHPLLVDADRETLMETAAASAQWFRAALAGDAGEERDGG